MSELIRSKEEAEQKRLQEQRVIAEMIALYCKGNHHEKALCKDCEELLEYSKKRLKHCPFMETKTFCSNCKVHCYSPEMSQRIREVMRYSGWRMLFVHPHMAISHLYYSKKEKKQLKKANGNQ